MTRSQQLLRDAAADICRAAVWLDPQRTDSDGATEQALKLMQRARLIVESVEMTLGRDQAVREETLRHGERS